MIFALVFFLPCEGITVQKPEVVVMSNGAHKDQASNKSKTLESYTFSKFVKNFKRTYDPASAEWALRENHFKVNLNKVLAQRKLQGKSWKAGINKFMDWTESEKTRIMGRKPARKKANFLKQQGDKHQQYLNTSREIPASVDWSNSHKLNVTGKFIRNQGMCGSCWAHGATYCLESHLELSGANPPEGLFLSAQDLISCTKNPDNCGGTGGCDGATEPLAFAEVKKNGIPFEKQYPLTSDKGEPFWGDTCNKELIGSNRVFIDDWVVLPENDHYALMNALFLKGPVSVSVAASSWFAYESGVFDGCNDDQGEPDFVSNHAVLAMGYGKDRESGYSYWLLKNTWGEDWGEKGFIRLKRSKSAAESQQTCGWDAHPEDGSGCDGGPPSVWVCGHCAVLYDSSYPINVRIRHISSSSEHKNAGVSERLPFFIVTLMMTLALY